MTNSDFVDVLNNTSLQLQEQIVNCFNDKLIPRIFDISRDRYIKLQSKFFSIYDYYTRYSDTPDLMDIADSVAILEHIINDYNKPFYDKTLDIAIDELYTTITHIIKYTLLDYEDDRFKESILGIRDSFIDIFDSFFELIITSLSVPIVNYLDLLEDKVIVEINSNINNFDKHKNMLPDLKSIYAKDNLLFKALHLEYPVEFLVLLTSLNYEIKEQSKTKMIFTHPDFSKDVVVILHPTKKIRAKVCIDMIGQLLPLS